MRSGKILSGNAVLRILCGVLLMLFGIVLFIISIHALYFEVVAYKSYRQHTDSAEYHLLYDGGGTQLSYFFDGLRNVWPETIAEDTSVREFLLVEYSRWEANRIGYVTLQYDASGYLAERERLASIGIKEWKKYYGGEDFKTYPLVAMKAGERGLLYALDHEDHTITYVCICFMEPGANIDYRDIIPAEYLPDGLDALSDSLAPQYPMLIIIAWIVSAVNALLLIIVSILRLRRSFINPCFRT